MKSISGFQFTASGTIEPGRLVTVSGDQTVAQASAATDRCIGVSDQESRRHDDDSAAIVGDSVTVHGAGSICRLELGGTVAAGDKIVSDANGKGVAAGAEVNPSAANTAPQFSSAVALQAGANGEYIDIRVTDPSVVFKSA